MRVAILACVIVALFASALTVVLYHDGNGRLAEQRSLIILNLRDSLRTARYERDDARDSLREARWAFAELETTATRPLFASPPPGRIFVSLSGGMDPDRIVRTIRTDRQGRVIVAPSALDRPLMMRQVYPPSRAFPDSTDR